MALRRGARVLTPPFLSKNPLLGIKFASTSCLSGFQMIGFIGLGNMGSPMAINLMKAGYKLVVNDRNEKVMSCFGERGALIKKTPREVAEASDAVITMLPSVTAVTEVYLGLEGLLSAGASIKPSLLIDASTVDPQTCRKISEEVSRRKLSETSKFSGMFQCPIMLDSPVSGGVPGANAGTLTFMVGGPEEGCKIAQPLFQAMGKRAVYCGGSGNGAAAKICNNLALGVSMAGISEALALGQRLGIDAGILSNIFNISSARCWSSDTYNPVPGVMEGVPAARNYGGGFSCHLMAKDLGLALAAAATTDSHVPLTTKVHEMYSTLCKEGKGDKDFSSIFRFRYLGVSEAKNGE